MHIDVEEELNSCVIAIGGRLVSDLVGPSPIFNNADYVFDEHRSVAELKVLSVDQIRQPHIQDKMSNIFHEASDHGESDVIVYGKAVVSSDNLSPKYARKIGEVYRAPIQRIVKKANRQIRQTKDHLDRKGYSGLLILVNDNHQALEPRHIDWVLQGILRDRNYSSIDSVLYFTVNLPAYHQNHDGDFLVWLEIHRAELDPCPEALLRTLQEAWFKKVSEVRGEPNSAYHLDSDALSDVEHKLR